MTKGGEVRLKKTYRARAARRLDVAPDGRTGVAEDHSTALWYFPGRFGFCPVCGDVPAPQGRDRNRLAGLSAEGRSSATTVIVAGTLTEMRRPERAVPEAKKKLLAFTDNRQDAALQAGHFNDFVFVTKLRAGLLAALRQAGDAGIADAELGERVRRALGYRPGRARDARRVAQAGPGRSQGARRGGRTVTGAGTSRLGRPAPRVAPHQSQPRGARPPAGGLALLREPWGMLLGGRGVRGGA